MVKKSVAKKVQAVSVMRKSRFAHRASEGVGLDGGAVEDHPRDGQEEN